MQYHASRRVSLFVALSLQIAACGTDSDSAPAGTEGTVIVVDNTATIAGVTPSVHGAPTVTPSPFGDALCFDGDDAVVLDTNPLEGLAAFTLEALVRVDAVTAAEFAEPRYLHIEDPTGQRATLEARVTDTQFYLDTYLLAGDESLTLIDDTKLHALGEWTWTALSYENGSMRHYVDGVEEANGSVTIRPFGAGAMSLGVRQNLRYWFQGCIRELRISDHALPAGELQSALATR